MYVSVWCGEVTSCRVSNAETRQTMQYQITSRLTLAAAPPDSTITLT